MKINKFFVLIYLKKKNIENPPENYFFGGRWEKHNRNTVDALEDLG